MNQVALPKPHLLQIMADKYSLEPEQFRLTVRATCGLEKATAEQFAAFLIVAKTYGLNPVTREIYAFAGRGGGIVPIVSIDGWVNLINSHGQCDGFEFDMEHDGEGKLIACTCRMYRKDRKYPTTVTEYLAECVRATDPWKMAHRMLRHKALIQAARYAFGFAGVYDEDEARNIIENEPRDVTPTRRVPSPSEVEDLGSDKYAPGDVIKTEGEVLPPKKDDPISTGRQKMPSAYGLPDLSQDYDALFNACLDRINKEPDGGSLETFWNAEIESQREMLLPPDYSELAELYGKRHAQLNEGR